MDSKTDTLTGNPNVALATLLSLQIRPFRVNYSKVLEFKTIALHAFRSEQEKVKRKRKRLVCVARVSVGFQH